jgi:hypothetical protein
MSGSRTFHNLPLPVSVALIGSGRPGPASSACLSKSETVFLTRNLPQCIVHHGRKAFKVVCMYSFLGHARLSDEPSLQLPNVAFDWFQFIE